MTATTQHDFDKNTEAFTVSAAFPKAIKGRTVLITGVNKLGIGFATVQAFAQQAPSTLILAARSQLKLEECFEILRSGFPDIEFRLLLVDLASIESVRSAANSVNAWSDVPKIDIVINNAGLMRHGEQFDGEMPTSADGIEDMFATNHLGHFLLTNLIMPKIIAAAEASPAGYTRIVQLSSSGTWVSPFRASDVDWKRPARAIPENERPNFKMMKMAGMDVDENSDVTYIPTAAYGQSKTCNILFALELNRRLFEQYGILSLAVNPGEVQSELGRNTSREWLDNAIRKREAAGLMHWKTLSGGASTTLVAACDQNLSIPDVSGKGIFLQDCQITQAPPWATESAAADKLWKLSEELVKEDFKW